MDDVEPRVAFDANVFFYAVDKRAPKKHRACAALLQNAMAAEIGCVPLQALGEFAYAAVRKGVLTRPAAAAAARDWAVVFAVITASQEAFDLALDWWRDERLSYWDALLVATACKARVTALVTEDLSDGMVFAGVEVISPFAKDFEGRAAAHGVKS